MNSKGFTLIELLVVVAIIAILVALITINFPRIMRQLALIRTAYQFAQDTRRAMNFGLSALQLPSGAPPGGYGIYVNTVSGDSGNLGNTEYIIYADMNNDKEYSSGDTVVQTINFSKSEPGIILAADQKASINFTPPNPLVMITGQSQITFEIASEPLQQRIVSVNGAGLIEVK